MFWNKKSEPRPLGVPLDQLQAMLAPTSIKATIYGNALLAKHEHYTVRVEVVPTLERSSENGPIQAVVRLTSELPSHVGQLFGGKGEAAAATFNSFAALGALYVDEGKLLNGSRLTIYEEEDSWSTLHLPLLAFTTICGNEAILGAMRKTFGGETPRGGRSEWTAKDVEQVEGYLSRICVCTTGDLGLTAEFPLQEGAVSVGIDGGQTALFQLMADQPHPELGGGLFCLLQMPHQIGETKRLQEICGRLNQLKMEAADLPPHFGAWCPGKLGCNPAYVSFLPNALHAASGIAVNTAFWAANRAQWANRTLASMGVVP